MRRPPPFTAFLPSRSIAHACLPSSASHRAGKEIESLKASLEVMTGKAAEAEAGLTKAQARLVELSHKEEVWGKEKELLEHQNQVRAGAV